MGLAGQQIIDLLVVDRLRMQLRSVGLGLAGRIKCQNKQNPCSFCFSPVIFPPLHFHYPTSVSFLHTHISRLLKSNLYKLLHHRQTDELFCTAVTLWYFRDREMSENYTALFSGHTRKRAISGSREWMLFQMPDVCTLHKTSCPNKKIYTIVDELSSLEINTSSVLNRY